MQHYEKNVCCVQAFAKQPRFWWTVSIEGLRMTSRHRVIAAAWGAECQKGEGFDFSVNCFSQF